MKFILLNNKKCIMKNKLKYFIYARKSQENDERQVQSIDDQLNVMKKKAKSM
jgi:hypothetical protein